MYREIADFRSMKGLSRAVLCLALAAPVLRSQTYSTVHGIVVDSSRAAVPGADLTLTRLDQGRSWQGHSNASGLYVFQQVPPGKYRLDADRPGFKRFTRTGLELQVGQAVEIDVELELGSLAEVVEVRAETPLLETSSSTLGEVVNARTTENLPLNGRNVVQLVALTPGVSGTPRYRTAATGSGNLFASGFSVNGGRNLSNTVLLDGSPQDMMGYNASAYVPSPDAVQEFKVQSNALAAEYGRTGAGVVNLVHRAGSSELHGVAYEFLRNNILDANGFFNNRNGKPKAAFRYNQFGGTLGGPLTPSRRTSFFFLNFEGIRQVNPDSTTLTLPTDRMKRGDFSEIAALIFDPRSVDAKGERQPFAGKQVPEARFDPVAVKLLSYYPGTNRAGISNNYFTQAGSRSSSNNWSSRIDRRISDRQNLFGRFSWNDVDTATADPFRSPASPTQGNTGSRNRSVTVDDSYALWGWILHGNYGYGYHADPMFPSALDIRPSSFGFPSSLDSAAQFDIFPRIQPDGYAAMGADSYFLCDNKFETHSWGGDAARLVATHTVKFGGNFRLIRVSNFRPVYPAGMYAFNEAWTRRLYNQAGGGDSIASLVLGLPASGMLREEPALASQIKYGALYLQDDWRLHRRLTLNLGLRWDADWPLTERHDRASWFDGSARLPVQIPGMGPLLGGLVFAGHRTPGAPRGIRDLHWRNFAPRAGIAYEVTQRLVVRSAYGVFFNPMVAFGDATSTGALGFNASTPVTTSIDGGLRPYATLANPFPDGFNAPENGRNGLLTFLGQTIGANLRGDGASYSMQWNFDIQYELQGRWLVDAAYVGSAGVALAASSNLNQLPDSFLPLGAELNKKVSNPFLGVIPASTSLGKATTTYGQLLRPYPWLTGLTHQWGSQAHSTYHAFQTKLRKRYSNGLQFLAAYTWSKMIDDFSSVASFLGQQNPGYTNSNNRRLDKSLSAMDVAHRLALNYQWELPLGKGKAWLNRAGWPAAAAGGWSLNGITTVQSGMPISITSATDTTGSFGGVQRPVSTGQSSRTPGDDRERIDAWFDAAAFVDAAPYRFGNVGRFLPDNRGPRFANWDLAVMKDTALGDQLRLQFRAELFNVFNQTSFQAPATVFGRPQFGTVTSSEPARVVQFGLKLYY